MAVGEQAKLAPGVIAPYVRVLTLKELTIGRIHGEALTLTFGGPVGSDI